MIKPLKIVVILTILIWMINTEEYKRCYDTGKELSQTGFCRRNINPEARNSSYYVEKDSIKIENNTVRLFLTSHNDIKDGLVADIFVFKYGMFRFIIDENYDLKKQHSEIVPENMKKRFRLNKEDEIFNTVDLEMNSDFLITQKDSSLNITSYYHPEEMHEFHGFNERNTTKYEIVIDFNPFKVTYFMNDSILLILNNNNLLNVEINNENDEFQTEQFSSLRLDVFYPEKQRLFGLLERAGDVELKDTDHEYYRLYNIDLFEYGKDQYYGLYGTWPFVMGHKESLISGFIWNNPSETYVRVKTQSETIQEIDNDSNPILREVTHGKETVFLSESGIIDLVILSDFNINNYYYKYHKLIGKPALPPMFSLGYHQSRWNYEDLNDLVQVDEKFDEHNIPYDTIWLDIEHTNEKRYMTWDSKFEGVANHLTTLEQKGRNLVVIIDPHIKNDENFQLFAKAKDKSYFVKTKDNNSIFIGKCWCEDAAYLDYYNPEVRGFWSSEIANSPFFLEKKNIHIWNDMNEPSVFKQTDLTIPKESKVNYYNETFEFRDVHNMYGYFMHKSSFEGLKKRLVNKRPFILTRSFYIGSHRYAAAWTGDNIATFNDLELSIPMLTNSALCGFSFIGADVGGFSKNTDHILMARWFQFGIFYPFFRGHSHNRTYRKEPWLYDNHTLDLIRRSIVLRYKLLPFIYTTFYQYYKVGTPMLRPPWFHHIGNEFLYNVNNQMMFGESILIRPVLSHSDHERNEITVVFPENERWFNLYTLKEIKGINNNPMTLSINDSEIGAYIKGGSILTLKSRIRRSSKLGREEPYYLVIALNKEERATGALYVDDEETYNFEKGRYSFKRFEYKDNELSIKNITENYQHINEIEKIVITGISRGPKEIMFTKINKKGQKKLDFEFDKDEMILTIFRMKVGLDEEWKIKLLYDSN